MSPEDEAKAKRLVLISHILGYGGLAMLIFGSIAAGILFESGPAAGGTAVLGLVMAGIGACIGQVGRAMQGRAI
jgi:membrane protein involved in colicin uptake